VEEERRSTWPQAPQSKVQVKCYQLCTSPSGFPRGTLPSNAQMSISASLLQGIPFSPPQAA